MHLVKEAVYLIVYCSIWMIVIGFIYFINLKVYKMESFMPTLGFISMK